MIDSVAMRPESSAMSPESRICQKLLTMAQELLFFSELCKTGDRGDRSDSNKYSGALTEGVRLD